MNDIYKHKAIKYKYKYLKLKREYLDEYLGGEYLDEYLDNEYLDEYLDNEYSGGGYLGEGTYGCIISPPIYFDHIKLLKNNSDITDFYNSNYIAKILDCNIYKHKTIDISLNIFEEEYKSYINLDNIDPEAKYRSKLIYAAIISRDKLINDQIDENTKKCIIKVVNIVSDTIFNTLYDENYNNHNFGYIISTKVGKSFDRFNLNLFNKENIINFLNNLKDSIDFIKILYEKSYIHADIKKFNMTYDEHLKKVYYIDFGLLHNFKDNKIIKGLSHYDIYPYIIFLFFEVEKEFENEFEKLIEKDNIYKIPLISKTKFIEKIKIKERNINQTNNNFRKVLQIFQIKDLDYKEYFKSLPDVEVIINENGKEETIVKEYTIYDFYYFCIVPIIKNIDIYSLSLVIYKLFFPFNDLNINFNNTYFNNKYFNNKTKKIIFELLQKALYNNINDPDELITYLEQIIDSINSYQIIEDYQQVQLQQQPQPQPVHVLQQPQPVHVLQKPQPQPQPVHVLQKPQPKPVHVLHQPQPVHVLHQPQPVQFLQKPETRIVFRVPQQHNNQHGQHLVPRQIGQNGQHLVPRQIGQNGQHLVPRQHRQHLVPPQYYPQ